MFQTRTRSPQDAWLDQLFSAKAVNKGGVLRRSKRDVFRNLGRDMFVSEVKRRGFHLIETEDQFIILCNSGKFRVVC